MSATMTKPALSIHLHNALVYLYTILSKDKKFPKKTVESISREKNSPHSFFIRNTMFEHVVSYHHH
jgi:hypothetical protein